MPSVHMKKKINGNNNHTLTFPTKMLPFSKRGVHIGPGATQLVLTGCLIGL